jgi:concentrative nucleoside transporter, CNT family
MSWLNLVSFFGIFALCAIAWAGSEARKSFPWKVMIWGVGLQLVVGFLVFQFPVTRVLMRLVSDNINAVLDATEAGSRFLFGNLLVPNPSQVSGPVAAGRWVARTIVPSYVPVPGDRLSPDNLNLGYILAFRALPAVVFFSALMSLLYNLKLVQPVVKLFGKLFHRTMGLSGAESLSGAANIFVGIESALVIRPFLANMTRSEICAILASCYGSIASTVLALYSQLLRPVFPNITGHLVSASLMAIPACFVIAKILVPETETPETLGVIPEEVEEAEKLNPMESVIAGALDGVKLAASIGALLIAVLGLVALVNLFFNNLAGLSLSNSPVLKPIGEAFKVVTVQNILGALFFPLTALTGISSSVQEIWLASTLVGRRLLETEIPAYLQLADLARQGEGGISDRALVIVSYILCGFAHLPSYGIFVGGFVTLMPHRRKDLTELGWKALWAATLATVMIGCVAGVFYSGSGSIIGRAV